MIEGMAGDDGKVTRTKMVIFGNSGAGKSTLARRLARRDGVGHLDLDRVAWASADPPIRRPVEESRAEIVAFIEDHPEGWVIEGCYGGLLEIAMEECTEVRFLNPGIEVCVENCKRRPWEPHKYESLEVQNSNLEMLIGWVRGYETREDEFSLKAHRALFEGFEGEKVELGSNEESREG